MHRVIFLTVAVLHTMDHTLFFFISVRTNSSHL